MKGFYSPRVSMPQLPLQKVAPNRFQISFGIISKVAQLPAPRQAVVMGLAYVTPRSPPLPSPFLVESGQRAHLPLPHLQKVTRLPHSPGRVLTEVAPVTVQCKPALRAVSMPIVRYTSMPTSSSGQLAHVRSVASVGVLAQSSQGPPPAHHRAHLEPRKEGDHASNPTGKLQEPAVNFREPARLSLGLDIPQPRSAESDASPKEGVSLFSARSLMSTVKSTASYFSHVLHQGDLSEDIDDNFGAQLDEEAERAGQPPRAHEAVKPLVVAP